MNFSDKKKCNLGDLVTFKRGYDLPVSMRTEGIYPVVSSSGITGFHKNFKVEGPGVVTGRYGTLGEVFYVSSRFWPLNTSLYVKDFKGNDPRFMSYYLRTVLSSSFNSAGAVPGVNRNVLHKLSVPMPPREQKKIAAILTAYDDLIENNKRRIDLLEKMAEEIYREWFVRFRFPGYDKVKFEKVVPVGWRTGKISDAASLRYGFTESALENSKLPKYLRVTDINKKSFINWSKVPNCQIDEFHFEKYMLKKGDIVIARMADPGKVAIIEQNIKAVFASYLIKIEYDPKKVTPYFLFYTLSSKYYLGLFSGADSGSTRSSINAGAIGNTSFVYPEIGLMRLFDKTVSVLREQIVNLNMICNNSERNKGMVLPRLISGKLSVEDLDIQFPPSMLEETEPEPQETAYG